MGSRSVGRRLRGLPAALLRHRWYTGGAVVVLVAAAITIYEFSSSSTPSSSAATLTYRLVAAADGTVRQSVSSTGTVEPAEDDSLNFAVSGTVTSVKVAAGDKVSKNQVLATIDSASLKASLAQAQAQLATAQAKVTSDEDSSASSDQLTADKAAESAASGQVDSAQAALVDATLRSPITGVVAAATLSVGDAVSGSGSSGGGGGGNNNSSSSSSSSAQFEVISTDAWLVNATVDATGVGLVKKGDQAQITTTGASGTVYGLITSVGVIASSSSSGAASYPVVVAVTGNPSGLHAGATATVDLIYKQLVNVLTVPTLAVHTDTNGKAVVWQSKSGKLDGSHTTKAVTTGLSSGGTTQILSGLSAGDEVLVQTVSLRRTTSTNGNNQVGNGAFFPGGAFPGGGGGGGGGGAFPGGGGNATVGKP